MDEVTARESMTTERSLPLTGRTFLQSAVTSRWSGLATLVLLAATLLVFPLLVDRPFLHIVLTQVFFYATLAQCWNILGGYAGQFSLGQSIFIGAGAYTSSLMLTKFGISPWIGLVAGMVVAALLAVVIGLPLFRLKGHYFAIATWLLLEIAQVLVIHWRWAGGAIGIHIPFRGDDPAFFQFNSKVPYYYIALVIMALIFAITYWLERSRPGYIFRAIKDDSLAASSLGVHILRYQLLAFVIYAMFSAVMGTFYAQWILVINPDALLIIDIAVLAMLMAVLGGMGTVWGPLLGALILAPATEFTRSLLGGQGRAISLIVYGAIIVILAIYEPKGLMDIFRNMKRRLLRS
jgi:branched-chain amino acid transport system permease protein